MNDSIERNFCDILNRIHIAARDDVDSLDTASDVMENGVPIRKLFISNLAERTTYKDLATLFSKYGNVESCFLRRNHGKSNYAFVTFSNALDALRARKDGWKKEIRLHNRDLRVTSADPWHQPDSIENQYYTSVGKDSDKLDKKSCNETGEQTVIEIDDTNTGIHRLNDDCLLHIFLCLPIVERVKLERVCKRWRVVSQESWCTVKRLDLSQATWGFPVGSRRSAIDTVTLRSALLRCGRFLNHIDITQIVHRLSQSTLTIIGKLCPNLQTIDVTAITISASGVNSLTYNCHNITKLSLGPSTCVDNDFIKLFKVNPKLEYIKIISNKISGKCLLHLPADAIKEIILDRCDNLEGDHLSAALASFKNLRNLSISKCIFLTYYIIQAIGIHCKHLRTLELSGKFYLICDEEMLHITNLVDLEILKLGRNEGVTDHFLDKLVSKCRRLTYLDIGGCRQVTNAGLTAIATLSKLETLVINYLINVTDEGLYDICNLRQLECRGCRFHDKSIMSLIKLSPNLELLDLSGCSCVTNETLELAVTSTNCRNNNIILKIFIGGTAVLPNKFFNVSPFLQVVNVDLSLHDEHNTYDDNLFAIMMQAYDNVDIADEYD